MYLALFTLLCPILFTLFAAAIMILVLRCWCTSNKTRFSRFGIEIHIGSVEEKKESKIEKSKITEEDSPKEEDEHSKKEGVDNE